MSRHVSDNLTRDVLAYVVSESRPVHIYEVAEQLGEPSPRVNNALCRLAEKGLIARVRWGQYSADRELRRRAILDRLEKLSLV